MWNFLSRGIRGRRAGRSRGGELFGAELPRQDEKGTLVLGGLFRSIDAASVVVKSGEKTFKVDEDYKLNTRWGMVANVNGRLGKPGEAELAVAFKYALQRGWDLVEVDGAGKASLKMGKAAMVCPELLAADAGQTGVAGIYVRAVEGGGGLRGDGRRIFFRLNRWRRWSR